MPRPRPLHLPKSLKSIRPSAPRLANPTWSVTSLLPPANPTPEISKQQLHHLLRLSALPPPPTPEAEQELLNSLHNHLHFVRAIQAVDTKDVPPLSRIEDEVGREEMTWEDVIGHDERLGKEGVPDEGRVKWKPTALAKRKAGGFFVVDEKVTELDVGSTAEKGQSNTGKS